MTRDTSYGGMDGPSSRSLTWEEREACPLSSDTRLLVEEMEKLQATTSCYIERYVLIKGEKRRLELSLVASGNYVVRLGSEIVYHGKSPEDAISAYGDATKSSGKPSSWTCPVCSNANSLVTLTCFKCGKMRSDDGT